MTNVLIIDDEKEFYDVVGSLAAANEISASHAGTLGDGIQKINSHDFDIVLLRDHLPDGTAWEGITSILEVSGSPEVIVFTQKGNPDEAELVLKNGAWDYVDRPITPKAILDLLKRAMLYRREKFGGGTGSSAINANLQPEGIIGSSHALQSCLNQLAKAAQSDANVLITGESGTGKELFAAAIHNLSTRNLRGFVVVDCAALPQTLVESILFGHEKGAFTGADKSRPGLVKQADNGTLFLDEVGELDLDLQKKFLRVLQERVFRPVGGNAEVESNFRLIAATNRDLSALVARGKFREDLLFRLQAFHLELPPLRSRPTDITELAYSYMARCCQRNRFEEKRFSPDFLMVLKQYHWPGNVRELFHALEGSIAAAQGSEVLFPMHLPTNIRIQVTRKALEGKPLRTDEPSGPAGPEESLPTLLAARDKAIEKAEKEYLGKLIKRTGGDVQESCRVAGLSRSRFYALLKKYQTTLPNRV